jgi:tRNA(Phe) wybutosine-synthesizing methylase Tyw3
MNGAFDASKRETLRKLQDAIDKSPKGSIDAPIINMIEMLNGHPNYVHISTPRSSQNHIL